MEWCFTCVDFCWCSRRPLPLTPGNRPNFLYLAPGGQIEALSLESLKAAADEYREHFSRALGRAIQGTIKVGDSISFFSVDLVDLVIEQQ